MSVHVIREQQRTRLIFDGALTIYEAHAARSTLLELLMDAQPIEVDLAGITEIDLSGVQLLLTLCQDPNLKFLSGESAAVSQALQLVNLQHLFRSQPAPAEH